MFKWVCMIHLSFYNTSYGRKKGWESKCQFDSQPLKVKNRPKLHVCRQCATNRWKSLNHGYNFVLDRTLFGGLQKKLWAFKVVGVPISRILRLSTWESWEKWHLDATPWLIIENIIRGKMLTSPKFGSWWILWVHVCPVIRLCTKNAPTMH